MTAMIHHIQKSIINVLASTDPARYADLKPVDMDGNQFSYHLKQLIAEKFVQKNEDGTYSLTKTGQTYLIHRYENLDEAAHTIFLAVIRHGDNILLRRRLVQPSLGYVGFIHGEPIASKSVQESVVERVKLKTALDLENIHVHGSGLIRIVRAGQIESFSHAIIISADAKAATISTRDETGENFWVDKNEIAAIDNLLPSCSEILSITESDSPAWFDLSYDL